MLTDVWPERLMQFLQESNPLVDWTKVAKEMAEQVRRLGND
jgi:hypothetical protein